MDLHFKVRFYFTKPWPILNMAHSNMSVISTSHILRNGLTSTSPHLLWSSTSLSVLAIREVAPHKWKVSHLVDKLWKQHQNTGLNFFTFIFKGLYWDNI